MPSSKVRRRSPYLSRSASRNTKREARKASVAPIELANEASSVPSSSPNNAPPASVSTAAPGSDRPVTTTYSARNPPAASHGCVAVHAWSASCRALNASRLSSPSSPLRHRAKAATTSTTTRIRRVLERDMRFLRRKVEDFRHSSEALCNSEAGQPQSIDIAISGTRSVWTPASAGVTTYFLRAADKNRSAPRVPDPREQRAAEQQAQQRQQRHCAQMPDQHHQCALVAVNE